MAPKDGRSVSRSLRKKNALNAAWICGLWVACLRIRVDDLNRNPSPHLSASSDARLEAAYGAQAHVGDSSTFRGSILGSDLFVWNLITALVRTWSLG